ncbi:MAG: hypothetical protein AAF804_10485, partial [Bacteroidota bacterium]
EHWDLEKLPGDLHCPQLESLSLRHNPLRHWPEDHLLKGLKQLDISYTPLASLPFPKKEDFPHLIIHRNPPRLKKSS